MNLLREWNQVLCCHPSNQATPDYCKTQSGPSIPSGDSIMLLSKPLENTSRLLPVYTLACIRDKEAYLRITTRSDTKCNFSLVSKLDSIVKQVGKYLSKTCLISLNRHRCQGIF